MCWWSFAGPNSYKGRVRARVMVKEAPGAPTPEKRRPKMWARASTPHTHRPVLRTAANYL